MKKISLIVAIAMICTMVMPISGFALTLNDVSLVKVNNEYFYDDFSKYDGTNITTSPNDTSIGYYGDPTYLGKDESNGTTAVKFSAYGANGSFNGPRGGYDGSKYNIFTFNIDKASFEDANKTLVFSYDAYVPYMAKGDYDQNLYSYIGYANNGDMNYLKWMAAGSKLIMTSAKGQVYMGYDATVTATTSANTINTLSQLATSITTDITATEGGRWVKLQTVMQYDSANQDYISWNYADGKPILNESGQIAKLILQPDAGLLDAIQNRNSLAFIISAKCDGDDNTAKNKDILIDNIAYYLYDSTAVNTGRVDEKTITLPIANSNAFADSATAPATVKAGSIDVTTLSNAKLTTENGTVISGATITATNSEIKVTVPASVGGGDKVKVDLTGVKDITGKQIGLDSNVYTINGAINAANSKYYQDFEGITALSEVGYNPGNISAEDTNKTFVLATTADKGNGLAVNYTAASSSKAVTAPETNVTYGFSVDASAFETAGKELEYGYDVFIPGGAYKGESLAGYLLFKKADGTVIQYCSELPALVNTDNTNPNLKFKAINDDSIESEWTGNNNIYTANSKPGVDQTNKSVYVDYAETEEGSWVSLKSRVSYIKDADGTGYYMTKYYINGEVVRNSDGSPAIFKIQENLAPANSGRQYLQFSLNGNNGENNANKIVVDNIFANVVDAEDGELTVYDFVGENGEYSFVYNNLSSSAKSYQFIIAGYGLNGKLINVDITKKGSFTGRSTGTVSSVLAADADITEYKVFLWEDFTTCTPIKDSLTD